MSELAVHENFSLSEQSLPITVTTYTAAPNACLFPAHWHRQLEILAVTQGSLCAVCADTVQTVSAGELLFVNAYESHVGTAGEEGVTYHCLIVEPCVWYDNLPNGSPASLPVLNNHWNDETLFLLTDRLMAEFRGKEPGHELAVRAYLLLLFSRAQRHHATATRPAKPETRIGEIMRYIHRHSTEKLSTRQLAEHFGFSLSYFCRYFKTTTGTTVLDYLTAVRLSNACRLLQQTDLPIHDVARHVGFSGTNYFVRQFHEQMGCSPLQFRKQNRP